MRQTPLALPLASTHSLRALGLVISASIAIIVLAAGQAAALSVRGTLFLALAALTLGAATGWCFPDALRIVWRVHAKFIRMAAPLASRYLCFLIYWLVVCPAHLFNGRRGAFSFDLTGPAWLPRNDGSRMRPTAEAGYLDTARASGLGWIRVVQPLLLTLGILSVEAERTAPPTDIYTLY